MLAFYDNTIFTQRQITTTLAEMSNWSLLWKLGKLYCKTTINDKRIIYKHPDTILIPYY